MRNLNELSIDVTNIPIAADDLAQLIDMTTDKVINNNAGKTVLAEMFKNGGKPEQIVKEKNLAQVSDEGFIQETIDKVLADNPSEVEKYPRGQRHALPMVRRSGGASHKRQSGYECGEGVVDEGVGGEEEVIDHEEGKCI